jgi:tripartite-type tricarboxylate transporter receptor subunit TctC
MKLSRRCSLAALAGLTTGILMPGAGRAETVLPDRALRMFIGFSANGGTDIMARAIATRFERRAGRRTTVEYRPGGVGAGAGEQLKRNPPDGTTIAFMPSTTLAASLVIERFPFDPVKDVICLTPVGFSPIALAISTATGASTFDDFLKWMANGEPIQHRIGSTASDAFLDIFRKTLGEALGAGLDTVHYRGALPMVNDLIAGRIPAAVATTPSLLEHHRSGRVRIVMVSGSKRLAALRDVPTAVELGYKTLDLQSWYGFFAAAMTPAPLVEEWNRQLRAVVAETEVAAQLTQLGLEVGTMDIAEAEKLPATDLGEWRKRMQEAGMKPVN